MSLMQSGGIFMVTFTEIPFPRLTGFQTNCRVVKLIAIHGHIAQPRVAVIQVPVTETRH
jgi:hypothetical protein